MSCSKMPMPTAIRFMYMDSWYDSAARKNPLRWGSCSSTSDLVHQLEAQSRKADRPVRIYAELVDGHIQKEFSNIDNAVRWLQTRMDSSGAFLGSESESFGLFGSCRKGSDSTTSGEFEVVDAAKTSQQNEGVSDDSLPAHPACSSTCAEGDATDESKKEHVKLRYMWADAGLLPISAMRNMAKNNPMRWSPARSPTEIVAALEQATAYWPERAVILDGQMPGEHLVRTFENTEKAVMWVRDEYNVEDETTDATDHRCCICLEAPVTVMLMPCRHAVLCEECAEPMLAGRRPCPICRTPIQNHAKGQFATDYVDLVQAMEARLEVAASTMHAGMYDHIKPLMVTGAILAGGAAACFIAFPPAAPALAAGAFAVGYVPWFATTASNFEREDLSVNLSAERLFTAEDFKNPLKLIVKALVMAVVAPVAAVAFFIPYGLYKCVLKPSMRAILHGIVRISAFAHVYGARPTGSALHSLGRGAVDLACRAGVAARDLALMLSDMCVSCGNATYSNVLEPVSRFIYNYVLTPSYRGIKMAVNLACECIAAGWRLTYEHALVPAAEGIQKAASFIYSNAVVPVSNGLEWIIRHLASALRYGAERAGDALARGATCMYTYVLAPCGRALADGLVLTAKGAYHASAFVLENLATVASATYSSVLVPMAGILASGASTLYVYAVAPCGRALFQAGSATVAGVSAAASVIAEYGVMGAQVVYVYALLPCGKVVAFVFTTGAGAVAAVAVPAAQAVGTCARATGAAVQTCGREVVAAAAAARHAGQQTVRSMGL